MLEKKLHVPRETLRKSCIFAASKTQKKMKVKLTKQQIDSILADPEQAENAKVKVGDPWWVIVLKVVAYVCGLLLAGACTAYVI